MFKSPKFLEHMAGIFKITRALIPKRKGWALPHHKVGLAEEVSRKWAQVVWPIIPRQIILIPRTECEKVALWYQAISYLCRMRNVRSLFYATNPHIVCSAGIML